MSSSPVGGGIATFILSLGKNGKRKKNDQFWLTCVRYARDVARERLNSRNPWASSHPSVVFLSSTAPGSHGHRTTERVWTKRWRPTRAPRGSGRWWRKERKVATQEERRELEAGGGEPWGSRTRRRIGVSQVGLLCPLTFNPLFRNPQGLHIWLIL